MEYLHVALLDDTEECLVSYTESGLREQVSESLFKRSIPPLNDEEWADCVKGEDSCERGTDCTPFGVIYYYKTESKLGDLIPEVNGSRK